MTISTELILLIGSVLFIISMLVGQAGHRFGVPILLLFLLVGMVFGSDGFGLDFENIQMAQAIGSVCLAIILFSGGLDTRFSEIKPVIGPGIGAGYLGGAAYRCSYRGVHLLDDREVFPFVGIRSSHVYAACFNGFVHRLGFRFRDFTLQGTDAEKQLTPNARAGKREQRPNGLLANDHVYRHHSIG